MNLDGHTEVTMDQDRRQDLLRVVERVAIVMADAGMPRMAARVYAYILAEDAERYTAKDISVGLGVSLAAVSGAVNYLTRVSLIERQREPGARADTYVIDSDDVWSQVMTARTGLIREWAEALADGAKLLGDSPGGRRLRESEKFFAFLRHDLETMTQRWRAYRETVDQRSASSASGRSTQSAT